MGGFFGAVKKSDAISDVFFGTDYHSHLGTRRAGMAAYNEETGLQREIHKIENSPFRTKFEDVFEEMEGNSAIGCISDYDPQPLLIRSKAGIYAICVVGVINNSDEIIENYIDAEGGHFTVMNKAKINETEIVAALIGKKDNFKEGIEFAQSVIEGSCSLLILKSDGNIITARDKMGRTPVLLGKSEEGYCVAFESFSYQKLGYIDYKELGPGEIVEITKDGVKVLKEPDKEMKICSFFWSYYGYPTSSYEGVNVEMMRYNNGRIMAKADDEAKNREGIDYVSGVPDSGTPHAIGYANESKVPFARPFIKYTPTWMRSFTPTRQNERNKIAKMKQIPVHEFIKDKKLLFVDDSIVRGTQLKETVDFLYEHGAKEVHMRSACPPIMFPCKYLSFSRGRNEMDLLARRIIFDLEGEEGIKYVDEYLDTRTERGKALRKVICDKFNFASLEFQSLDGLIEAIGIEKCKLCTYCWNGKE